MAGRDSLTEMQGFVTRHGLAGSFPQLADLDGELWTRFGVRHQPTWVFVDDTGAVSTVFGALSHDELAAEIEELAGS